MFPPNAKYPVSALIGLSTTFVLAGAALAQGNQNDFFGSGLPNTQQVVTPSPASPSGAPGSGLVPAPTSNGASPTDYTQDEKRMQKKAKDMAAHIKNLIAKGERMMKSGQAHHNDKDYKKGKVLKEIGEKQLAELKASQQQALDAKKEEKEKADGT